MKNHDNVTVPALALRQPIDFNLVTEGEGGIGGSEKPQDSNLD